MTNAAPGLGLGGMVEGYCGYSERSLRPVCRRELAVPRVVLVVGFGDPLLVVDAAGHDSGRRLSSFVAGLFFSAPDIHAAVVAVRKLGGQADDPGPEEPGFGRFTFCRDDQGVRFGLHQPPIA